MSIERVMQWFPYVFPFLFVGMWLVASTMLGRMSGWFDLQRRFPDDAGEAPLLTLRRQSAAMGRASMQGVLTLRAYPSGLGIAVWRIFGPFQKPIKIPWDEIEGEHVTSFLAPMMKLRLGRTHQGKLSIPAGSWTRLVAALPEARRRSLLMPPPSAAPGHSLAQALLLQWAAFTALAAAFFYVSSRAEGSDFPMPLAACILFPAVFVGIGQIVRYLRER